MKISLLILGMVLLQGAVADVIVMRHGEADHNIWKRFNSDPQHENYVPSYLTAKGEREVHRAAEKLKELGYSVQNITHVYVSPLPRAQQTADILMNEGVIHQKNRKTAAHLTEVNFGSYENRPNALMKDTWVHDDAKAYGGETDEELRQRVFSLCKEAAKGEFQGHILLITHGSPALEILHKVKGVRAKTDPAGFFVLSKDEFKTAFSDSY